MSITLTLWKFRILIWYVLSSPFQNTSFPTHYFQEMETRSSQITTFVLLVIIPSAIVWYTWTVATRPPAWLSSGHLLEAQSYHCWILYYQSAPSREIFFHFRQSYHLRTLTLTCSSNLFSGKQLIHRIQLTH